MKKKDLLTGSQQLGVQRTGFVFVEISPKRATTFTAHEFEFNVDGAGFVNLGIQFQDGDKYEQEVRI